MPIYEYCCKTCEYKFEEIQKIDDDPIKVCPRCREDGLSKLVSWSSGNVPISRTNSRDYYEKVIKPDAARIIKKAKEGDEDTLLDIYGEKRLKEMEEDQKNIDEVLETYGK